jgi:hypothetical protein
MIRINLKIYKINHNSIIKLKMKLFIKKMKINIAKLTTIN